MTQPIVTIAVTGDHEIVDQVRAEAEINVGFTQISQMEIFADCECVVITSPDDTDLNRLAKKLAQERNWKLVTMTVMHGTENRFPNYCDVRITYTNS